MVKYSFWCVNTHVCFLNAWKIHINLTKQIIYVLVRHVIRIFKSWVFIFFIISHFVKFDPSWTFVLACMIYLFTYLNKCKPFQKTKVSREGALEHLFWSSVFRYRFFFVIYMPSLDVRYKCKLKAYICTHDTQSTISSHLPKK